MAGGGGSVSCFALRALASRVYPRLGQSVRGHLAGRQVGAQEAARGGVRRVSLQASCPDGFAAPTPQPPPTPPAPALVERLQACSCVLKHLRRHEPFRKQGPAGGRKWK